MRVRAYMYVDVYECVCALSLSLTMQQQVQPVTSCYFVEIKSLFTHRFLFHVFVSFAHALNSLGSNKDAVMISVKPKKVMCGGGNESVSESQQQAK